MGWWGSLRFRSSGVNGLFIHVTQKTRSETFSATWEAACLWSRFMRVVTCHRKASLLTVSSSVRNVGYLVDRALTCLWRKQVMIWSLTRPVACTNGFLCQWFDCVFGCVLLRELIAMALFCALASFSSKLQNSLIQSSADVKSGLWVNRNIRKPARFSKPDRFEQRGNGRVWEIFTLSW